MKGCTSETVFYQAPQEDKGKDEGESGGEGGRERTLGGSPPTSFMVKTELR